MNILISGGSGFLGKRVASLLARDGRNKVHAISLHGRPSQGIQAIDIRRPSEVATIFETVRPQWVFHLAGDIRHGEGDVLFQELFSTNVSGTALMLSAAAKIGVKAFIAAGSFEEYGDAPTPFMEDGPVRANSPYGVTKAMASLLTVAYGKRTLPAAVLRFPVVYGPGCHDGSFLGRLSQVVHTGRKLEIPNADIEREFLHVDDAASALVLASGRIDDCRGEAINICCGKKMSLRDVVSKAESILEKSGLAEMGKGVVRANEQLKYVGSPLKSKKLLGFEPSIEFDDGLRALLT